MAIRNDLEGLAKLARYWVLRMTSEAGSGHPTSCLSAVELMVGLMFGGYFRFAVEDPKGANNDRLIFSKGHAAPLLYTLWMLATDGAVEAKDKISEEELLSLREFNSRLEGHPTLRFPYAEVATGSLGQGLSVGLGMALAGKMDDLDYHTWVMLGDSEMAEGSVWEAVELAGYYGLGSLVGILDVNRLGQRGETMLGWNTEIYERRLEAFGWQVVVVDGHNLREIGDAYQRVVKVRADKPTMVVAKTVKGKGVSWLENQEGWHGRALTQEELVGALGELGEVKKELRGRMALPAEKMSKKSMGLDLAEAKGEKPSVKLGEGYRVGEMVATREAYGQALVKLGVEHPEVVVLDAEVGNSTHAGEFKKYFPKRFWEMYIAEQNMIGAAVGLAARGEVPFASSFSAFLSRAADQLRMAGYSGANVKICGSHAGVEIGEDGPSQMGLEDLAIFRSIWGSVVVCPADAVSCEKLMGEVFGHRGLAYVRTARMKIPVIYGEEEGFKIGGAKVLRESREDAVAVLGAGVTVHEAIKAFEILSEKGVKIRVIDVYSIKPLDVETLIRVVRETKAVVTVEDHYAQGGMGEAVVAALAEAEVLVPVHSLAIRKLPRSGKPEELMDDEGISARRIVEKVVEVLNTKA